VLVPGAAAPRLVTEEMVQQMRPGSAIVDVAIDQGGCVETMKPTSHAQPTFLCHDVVHYGVTNMPAAVPRTSTWALTNATLPYALAVARLGWQGAALADESLAMGFQVVDGKLVHQAVAEAFGMLHVPLHGLV
jgi:alanine dehydrogenase